MKRFFRKLLSVFGPAVVSALGFSGCDIIPIGRAEYGSQSADFKVDISVTDESGNTLKDIKVTPVLLYTSVNKNYMGQDLPPKTIREELPALSTDEAGKALNMYSLTSVSKDVRLIFEDVDGELNGGSFAKDSVDLAVVKSKNGDNNWYSGEWTVSGKMKLNKEMIIKNLNAILCGLCIVCLILPFCNIEATASVMGYSASEGVSVSGIDFITGCGLWGILFIIAVIAVLVCNYVDKLRENKKLITMLGSFVMILSLFMAPGSIHYSEGDSTASAEVKATYAIGFWLILIFALLLLIVAVISFFNLKGNAVFDAVNSDNDGEGKNVSFGNVGEKISGAAKNVKDKVSETAGRVTNKSGNNEDTEKDERTVTNASKSNAKDKKEDNEYIMEQITQLFNMKEKGILSEEEFNEKKAELLKQM